MQNAPFTVISNNSTAFYDSMFTSTAIKATELETLMLDLIKKSVEDTDALQEKIRPLPQLQMQLLDLLSKDSTSYQAVAELIGKDPTLSLKILQVVNSAQSNAGFQISNLETAVARLGMNGIASIASAIMMRSINPPKPIYYKLYGKKIWTHSLQCAHLCKGFAQAMEEDEFLGHFMGLIHDVGKILIFESIVDALTRTDLDSEIGSQEFRESITDISLELSYKIAREWNLPDEICTALYEQNSIAKSTFGICLNAANECSELFLCNEAVPEEELPVLVQNDEKLILVWREFTENAELLASQS